MYKFLQARVMLILIMFTVSNSYSATFFSRESIARAYREVYLAKITASLKAQTGNQSINGIKNGAIIALFSLAAVGGAYYCYSYYPELITGKKNTQNNWWYTYFLQKPYNGIKAVITYPGYLCGY